MSSELADIGVQVPEVPGPIDEIEARIVEAGGAVRPVGGDYAEAPTVHRFTPGLYSRTIYMPAGQIITSKIHKTEHQFIVSAGRCVVYTEGVDDWVTITAPFVGTTKPGTRRLLAIIADTIWTTFHPTDTTDLEELERELLVEYENPLLAEVTE